MVPPKDKSGGGSFQTTPWSLLLIARGGPLTEQQIAVSRLCEIYWHSVYLYIQARGYSPEDTSDLTLRFLTYLIEREAFAKADKAKGKFRSYVLGILKHFLLHDARDERAQKRGGGLAPVPLDEAVASETETPEARRRRLSQPDPLDREWALAIQRRVEDRIAGEYTAAGRSELYLTIRRHLTAEKSVGSYKDDARRLGRSIATVRSDVSRMRDRYREILREELRKAAPNADPTQELFYYYRLITMP